MGKVLPKLNLPIKRKAVDPELEAQRARTRAAVRRIAREYEQKRHAAGLDRERFHRTPFYYVILVLVMVLLAGIFIGLMTGRMTLGKPRLSKAHIQARKSVDALAVALGRYRFHVGEYPSEAEGLSALSAITPQRPGWFGPYIRKVVPDPWGHDYAYWPDRNGGAPALMSAGPDGKLGTTDDILADRKLFEEPFRDTTWTNHWVPYTLRGIVVAPNEAARKAIQEEVKQY